MSTLAPEPTEAHSIDTMASPDGIERKTMALTRLALIGYGLLAALLLSSWIGNLASASNSVPGTYLRDFIGIYIGEKIVVGGQGPQLYDLAVQRQALDAVVAPLHDFPFFIFIYPAYVALLFYPLGLLSYLDAASVMLIVNVALSVLALAGSTRVMRGSRVEKVVFVLAAISFVPLTRLFWQGQLTLWPLLGLTGALLSLRAGHERRAGAWLWLGLIKPQLIVVPLLVLLLQRRWRALATFAGGALALLAASLLAFGNWLPGYLHLLLGSGNDPAMPADMVGLMQNWRGLVYSLFGDGANLASTALYAALIGASLAVVVWRSLRDAGEGPLALAALLGLMIVPHLYAHDLVLVLLPAAYFWWASSAELARNPDPATATRLRLARWLIALAPLAYLVSQFLPLGNWQPFPWYAFAFLLVALPVWGKLQPAR